MDRNVLNDGVIITNAYGMNKYEYLDRIVFSNEYMNNIILEYKDIKSITVVGNEQ